jgi:hypothetical protein
MPDTMMEAFPPAAPAQGHAAHGETNPWAAASVS